MRIPSHRAPTHPGEMLLGRRWGRKSRCDSHFEIVRGEFVDDPILADVAVQIILNAILYPLAPNRMRLKSIVCSILIALSTGTLARGEKPEYTRTEDVIYGRKFGTALTMDV